MFDEGDDLDLAELRRQLERAPASTVTQSRVGARRKQQLHPIGSGAEDRFVQRRAATCVLRVGLRTCCE